MEDIKASLTKLFGIVEEVEQLRELAIKQAGEINLKNSEIAELENKLKLLTPNYLIFGENFEGKTKETAFQGLTKQTVENAHAFDVAANLFGRSRIGKFELRQTDRMQSNGMRSEILFPIQRGENANDRWFAFDVYLPSETFGDDSKQDIITQWHQGSGNPPLSLRMINGRMLLDTRSTKNGIQKIELDQWKPIPKDQWIRFIFHIVFANDESGLIEVEQNGVKIITHRGPNCYDVVDLPRWKLGIYKSDWNNGKTTNQTLRILYFDNIKFGNEKATYELMKA